MGMQRWGNAWEPGQRTWVGRCGPCEARIEDGGHVAGSAEVSSGGGGPQVEEWVLTGVRCQAEQVCSEGRPRRLAGEVGYDLVGLAVEHLHHLGANQLLGG